jgi:UDP-N-acetylglucosamine enolpyruvyl transferase
MQTHAGIVACSGRGRIRDQIFKPRILIVKRLNTVNALASVQSYSIRHYNQLTLGRVVSRHCEPQEKQFSFVFAFWIAASLRSSQ